MKDLHSGDQKVQKAQNHIVALRFIRSMLRIHCIRGEL